MPAPLPPPTPRPTLPTTARAALAFGALSLASACAVVLGFDETSVVDALEAGASDDATTAPPDAPLADAPPTPTPDATPLVDAARDEGAADGLAPDGAPDASPDGDPATDAGAPHPGCLRQSVDSATTAIQPVRDNTDVRFVVTEAVAPLSEPKLEVCTPVSRTVLTLTLRQITQTAPYTYESPQIALPAGTSQVVLLTGNIFPAVRETLFYAR